MFRTTLSLLALASLTPSVLAGEATVTFRGTVSVDSYSFGPYQNATVGTPMTLSFDVATPGNVIGPGEHEYALDLASFTVEVAGVPVGGVPSSATDLTVEDDDPDDGAHVAGGLTNGDFLVCEFTALTSLWSSPDLTQLGGLHDVQANVLKEDWHFSGAGGFLGITIESMEVGGAGPIGTNYCGPAALNSTGQSGVISAFGQVDVAAGDVRLDAAQLALNQNSYFITSETQGFVNPPGSQGFLCLGGTIGRFNANVLNTGAAGEVTLQLDLTNFPIGPGVAVQPGETWNFQLWYRDVNPTATSNFTDGLSILFL